MMMDDEEGEMHLRNLKLYEATTEEVSHVCTVIPPGRLDFLDPPPGIFAVACGINT